MLTTDQIKHIANLARLEISPDEEKKYSAELSSILNYIDKLKEVNTEHVLIKASGTELINSWREDQVKPWSQAEINLALSASEVKDGQVKVKRVL